MKAVLLETAIPDVKIIKQFRADDHRGTFVKPFHDAGFREAGIHFTMKESFFSLSKKGVIRGMHFHLPPYQHDKIVFCTAGAILDVALDLRKNSGTYGKYVHTELSFDNNHALLIPAGFAHGFLTLTETATAFYFISGEYHAASDAGILYNSFGMDWGIREPILSQRDRTFLTLDQFQTPF